MTKRLLAASVLTVGMLSAEDAKFPIPRFKLDTVGWGLTLAAGTTMALDYHSTQSILSKGGHETNSRLTNSHGGLSYGKALAFDTANLGSILLSEGVLKWRVPEKHRWIFKWIVEPAIGMGIAYRLKVGSIHNYQLLANH